jgi:serine/threonine-protein kinase RsbW
LVKAFSLKNDRSEIRRLVEELATFGRDNALPSEMMNDIRLVVEEIVTNIISYGYDDGKVHWIDLRVELKSGQVTVRIKDDGKPFDPTTDFKPDIETPFENRRIGGMGIYLIQKLMDEIHYEYENGNNVLVIKKAV